MLRQEFRQVHKPDLRRTKGHLRTNSARASGLAGLALVITEDLNWVCAELPQVDKVACVDVQEDEVREAVYRMGRSEQAPVGAEGEVPLVVVGVPRSFESCRCRAARADYCVDREGYGFSPPTVRVSSMAPFVSLRVVPGRHAGRRLLRVCCERSNIRPLPPLGGGEVAMMSGFEPKKPVNEPGSNSMWSTRYFSEILSSTSQAWGVCIG